MIYFHMFSSSSGGQILASNVCGNVRLGDHPLAEGESSSFAHGLRFQLIILLLTHKRRGVYDGAAS